MVSALEDHTSPSGVIDVRETSNVAGSWKFSYRSPWRAMRTIPMTVLSDIAVQLSVGQQSSEDCWLSWHNVLTALYTQLWRHSSGDNVKASLMPALPCPVQTDIQLSDMRV